MSARKVQHLHRLICRDCGVRQGELHQLNCCMEVCRKCGGQAISCGCEGRATKPRRPFIAWRDMCGMCGDLLPQLFHVPKAVWAFYIEHEHRNKIVCLDCWHFIEERTDGGAYARKHGQALLEHSPAWLERVGKPLDTPDPFVKSIFELPVEDER